MRVIKRHHQQYNYVGSGNDEAEAVRPTVGGAVCEEALGDIRSQIYPGSMITVLAQLLRGTTCPCNISALKFHYLRPSYSTFSKYDYQHASPPFAVQYRPLHPSEMYNCVRFHVSRLSAKPQAHSRTLSFIDSSRRE